MSKAKTRPQKQRPSAPRAESESMFPTRERQRKGEFTEARTYEFEPDERGVLARKAVRTIRAADCSAAGRLARAGLRPAQLMAAVMFERDHELGRLDPKVTANMEGSGGGQRAAETANAVLDARDRKHDALNALRLAGPIVVQVVEDVVLNRVGVTAVALARTPVKAAGLMWANLALTTGLTLLEHHYRASGRLTDA